MLDCKQALQEADGDFDKAVEPAAHQGRQGRGQAGLADRCERSVAAHLAAGDHGVMLEPACETDFVAKTEGFQSLAADVAAFVAVNNPGDLDELLAAEYEAGTSVRDLLEQANATMGEKIEIRRFTHVKTATSTSTCTTTRRCRRASVRWCTNGGERGQSPERRPAHRRDVAVLT